MTLDDRNTELDKALKLNPIDEQIAALARSDKSRTSQIRWLAVSLALDVLLTIGFGYTTFQAQRAADQAETNKTAIVRSCETSNEARKNNRVLWDYILSIPPSEPLTKEQKVRVAEFKTFVNKTFAPRNCMAEINK